MIKIRSSVIIAAIEIFLNFLELPCLEYWEVLLQLLQAVDLHICDCMDFAVE